MTVVAIVLAAAAAALFVSRADSPTAWRARTTPTGMARSPTTGSGQRAAIFIGFAGIALLLTFVRGTVLALGLIGLCVVLAAGRLLVGFRRRKEAENREQQVLEVCEVLVGELRAGQPPVIALARSVEAWPEFEPVPMAARLGSDVPAALRELAKLPGAAGLRHIAGAWQVSQGAGAGLAVGLAQVAASAREAQATRRLIASELASARATARLVAGLPVVALAMGSGIGGDPWSFLLTTPAGLVCLAVGLGFAFAGLGWIDRIAMSVVAR